MSIHGRRYHHWQLIVDMPVARYSHCWEVWRKDEMKKNRFGSNGTVCSYDIGMSFNSAIEMGKPNWQGVNNWEVLLCTIAMKPVC